MSYSSAADFDVIKDANDDHVYDTSAGDTVQAEVPGNTGYLIHQGGDSAESSVGLWSYGCQVVPGWTADGSRRNVDEMYEALRDQSFKEVILDGQDLLDVLARRSG